MQKIIYKVLWHQKTIDDFRTLSLDLAIKIKQKVEKYLSLSLETLGKKLISKEITLYRYRYGDYRIIYKIEHNPNTITVLRIGHRKNIYDS